METWVLILMILLILGIAALAPLVFFTEKSNDEMNKVNVLYPFTGRYNNNTGDVELLNVDKKSQISCGDKNNGTINIVGAFFDLDDPYGQCTGESSRSIESACGIPVSSGTVSCSTTKECGDGMSCDNGKCRPATATVDSNGNVDVSKCRHSGTKIPACPINPGTVCKTANDTKPGMICKYDGNNNLVWTVIPGNKCFGVNTTYNTCALFPDCGNADISKNTVINNTCKSRGKANCMSRDASAYLAKACDGKSTCNPSLSKGDLGPLPCASGYIQGLPVSSGDNGKYNQGFSFHGLYTCIPSKKKQ